MVDMDSSSPADEVIRSMWTKTAIIGAVLAAVLVAYSHYEYWSDISYTQNYLKLYASSIYECHDLTGKWPTKIDDFAKTSLAVKYPQWWKSQLESGADVIVWPKNLKPDPKGNGHVILVYHYKGLDAEEGRMWVCWGDLRTEWITPGELKKHLDNQK